MNSPIVTIGPYRGQRVATGGFADVYHVPESPHGCPVAVKWSHASLNGPEQQSMAHEYALLSEFRHMRLPRAHAFGWEKKRPYLVVDWIEGQALHEFRAASDEDIIVTALRELARVLTFVHGRGWVHGDLKPDNLLWGSAQGTAGMAGGSPVLYLMDFGLARPVGDRDRPRGAGTVGYTAPEFLRQDPADGRADWYSAGVVLYEWVYGERPFASEETADEVAGHLERAPDFERTPVRPMPPWMPQVIARLLAKDPDERAADISDLLTWLSQFDAQLHPDVIFGELLDHHRRSEDRRLTAAERQLLDQMSDATRWTICADRTTAERLTRGLMSTAAETNDASSVELCWRAPSRPDDCQDDASSVSVTTLAWGGTAVAEYLDSVTGDQRISSQWAERIRTITSGLPAAVSGLLRFLHTHGHMRCSESHWVIDDGALEAWRRTPNAAAVYAEALGDLTPDEARIIDWFSIGRSFMQLDLLAELLPVSPDRLCSAFHALQSRGVVIPQKHGEGFLDWRVRLTGLAGFWRSRLPEALQRRLASQLATTLENCSLHHDLRVTEVMAVCFADAHRWDKCVHHSVTLVAARLKENQPEAALPFVELAAEAAQHIPEGKSKSHWLGRAMMARGDYQEACGQIGDAMRTFRELLAFGRKSKDRRLLAETLKDLGSLYRLTRRFEKGVHVLRRARQLWEQIGDRAEVARTLNNLGNIYWVASDRAEARRYYTEGLEIARELGQDQIVANILSNLGVTYKCDYDFARAEKYYRDSLAIKERLDLPAEIALTLNNLGVIAFDQGRLSEADQHFTRAIELNDRVGAEAESVFARGNLIQVILERGDLRTAVANNDAAIRDADKLGDVSTGAELRGFMAEAYQRAGDFHTSHTYMEEARRLATGQKNYDLDGHLGLIRALRCLRLGRGAAALEILDGLDEAIAHAEMPRLRLDAAMIRITTAVARGDNSAADDWWERGRAMAQMYAMPHKLAQLALSRLPADPTIAFPADARVQVEEFLQQSDDRWHWAPSFRLWSAHAALSAGDWNEAERLAAAGIDLLRMDGNWETLWRALEVYGSIFYRRSDYEPALAAFNEAETILAEITKTIDDDNERAAYRAHPQAINLSRARQRIVELVS